MMAKIIERLRADSVVFFSLISGVIAEIVFGIVLLFNLRSLPPLVPLIYSLPWGQGQLVSRWMLPVLFVLGAITLFFELILAHIVLKKEILLGRIIMAGCAISVILLATTATKIILLTHF